MLTINELCLPIQRSKNKKLDFPSYFDASSFISIICKYSLIGVNLAEVLGVKGIVGTLRFMEMNGRERGGGVAEMAHYAQILLYGAVENDMIKHVRQIRAPFKMGRCQDELRLQKNL